MKIKPIQFVITKSGQSAALLEVLAVDKLPIRLHIKSDSHPSQSHAYIETWDETAKKWHDLGAVPFQAMKTPHGLAYVPREVVAADFKQDRAELLRIAGAILNLPERLT